MSSLIVICPDCKEKQDLGEKALEVWNSSFAFQLDIICKQCGLIYDQNDLSESDFIISK